jgi:DeoR/GlpR family transcriptional regulator of sugar metabolism
MYESRKRTIYDQLQRHGAVTVSELAALLAVSDMTVRRDLRSMAAEGLLRPVHGGAVALAGNGDEKSFASRQVEQLERKQAIARKAVTLLRGGESLYLDGSTTCAELARLLHGRSHLVVTDSLSVLRELQGCLGIELALLGGNLEKDGNTFDGLLAVENARRVQVDCCFFSARGFTPEGISNTGMIGSQVKKIMIAGARRCILLADSTKCGQSGVIRLCGWAEVDVLITDSGLPAEALAAILAQGTEVQAAELPGEAA